MKNYSRQREEIIRVIKKLDKHPTAEEVYMIVKAQDPSISRSTVYRNLNGLVNENILNRISMAVGPDRYDYHMESHNHAICTKCGRIMDFNYDFNMMEMKDIVLNQTGIEITKTGITFEGICDLCRNKK